MGEVTLDRWGQVTWHHLPFLQVIGLPVIPQQFTSQAQWEITTNVVLYGYILAHLAVPNMQKMGAPYPSNPSKWMDNWTDSKMSILILSLTDFILYPYRYPYPWWSLTTKHTSKNKSIVNAMFPSPKRFGTGQTGTLHVSIPASSIAFEHTKMSMLWLVITKDKDICKDKG
jgi:hypothetical protein